ncbi:MAG: SURF1 family protein [Litorivicinaceae bacterium]|jgi:surfeit locus 1 family protein
MWLTKKWWFLIVVIPIVGLCIKAGFWQLDRAHQKEELIRVLTVGESLLTSGSDMLSQQVESGTHQVQLTVYRDTATPLRFLDNRIQDRVAGYEVFTEATSSDGSVRVLVNLGWVPGPKRRDELPTIEIPTVFELKGLWVPITDSYLMSESDTETLGDAQRVQSLTDLIKTNLLSGMVLAEGLLPRNANGPKPRLGPETHYGYAIQWFLLALVLCGMTAVILRKGVLRG